MKYLLILLAVFACLSIVKAQPRPPGGDPPCWPPSECIPVDGGVIALAVAGLALGGKKLSAHKKL